jgi:hypothetical protein
MIPQQMVENPQTIDLVFSTAPIGYRLSLSRMGMPERQSAMLVSGKRHQGGGQHYASDRCTTAQKAASTDIGMMVAFI